MADLGFATYRHHRRGSPRKLRSGEITPKIGHGGPPVSTPRGTLHSPDVPPHLRNQLDLFDLTQVQWFADAQQVDVPAMKWCHLFQMGDLLAHLLMPTGLRIRSVAFTHNAEGDWPTVVTSLRCTAQRGWRGIRHGRARHSGPKHSIRPPHRKV